MGFDNSFLEAEVRNGFLIPASVKQAWAAQLEVLQEVDALCQKYGIKYFADWGTLLGAVRHGGYVPWDDDLDIVMVREDYERFLQVAGELPEGFGVHTYWTHPDHWLFLANVVSKSRICFEKEHLERFHGFPYISGMDIFVLDYVAPQPNQEHDRDVIVEYIIAVADDIAEEKLKGEAAIRAIRLVESRTGENFPKDLLEELQAYWGDCEDSGQSRVDKTQNVDNASQNAGQSIVQQNGQKDARDDERNTSQKTCDPSTMALADFSLSKMSVLHRQRVWMYHLAEKWFGHFDERDCTELTQLFPFGLSGRAMRLPKAYYQEQIRIPFEYTTIPVPVGYAEMLSRKYGDYMKLVKNAGGHDYPYFKKQKESLEKVLDFEMPGYQFHKEDLVRNHPNREDSYKEMLKEAYLQLQSFIQELLGLLEQPQLSEEEGGRVLSLLTDSQQLALDMGNLLETVKGSSCKVIPVLEEYCEAVFLLYSVLTGESETDFDTDCLGKLLEDLEHSLEQYVYSRREVVFLPFAAKHWDTLDPVWKGAMLSENVDVYVVALPYYYKNYDGSLRDMQYALESYPEKLHVLHVDDFSLALHQPEVIVFQNPYDEYDEAISVPPGFYARELQKYTEELIYVPYFSMDEFSKENERDWENTGSYVCKPGVVGADHVVAPSAHMREMYVEKLCEFAGGDTKSVWMEKIVCPELLLDDIAMESAIESTIKCTTPSAIVPAAMTYKTIFYYVGIGQMIQNGDAELEKMRRSLELMHHKGVHVILWQDDCFLNNLKRLRPELNQAYESLVAQYENEDWFLVYREENPEKAILLSDAYYGDTGPYLLRFSEEHKPVMVQDISC